MTIVDMYTGNMSVCCARAGFETGDAVLFRRVALGAFVCMVLFFCCFLDCRGFTI